MNHLTPFTQLTADPLLAKQTAPIHHLPMKIIEDNILSCMLSDEQAISEKTLQRGMPEKMIEAEADIYHTVS